MAAGFVDYLRMAIGWKSVRALADVSERFDLIGSSVANKSLIGTSTEKFAIIGTSDEKFLLRGS